MIVKIDFGMHQEFIDIDNELKERIEQIQKEFLEWLYNKENDHKYWIIKNGNRYGVQYRASAFIEWLHANVCKKVKLLEGDQYAPSKTIYF